MFRHYRLLAVVVATFLFLSSQCLLGQSGYVFNRLVSSGNVAPSPHIMGNILESSLNDWGRIVYGADNGLFNYAGGQVILFGEFGRPAPGGGQFFDSWSSAQNSRGEIVFRGEVSAPSVSGLFLNSRGKITPLIPDGTVGPNGAPLTPQYPVLNVAGDFAFVDGRSSGLYLYSKGVITPIAVPGQSAPGGGTFNVISQYGINQSDQIAFNAYLSTGGTGIYLFSSGAVTKIIASGDKFPDGSTFAFAEGVSINDSGQVAFGGVNNNGSAQYEGLFLFSGGQYNVILPTGSSLPNGANLEYVFDASINNVGQIAIGCDTFSGFGTYIFSAGTLTQVAVSGETAPDGDVFSNEGEYGVQINNSGEVLLLSSMEHHYDALYLFSNGALIRIAGEGDPVDHTPRFEFPTPVNIAAGDELLISDSTFPGGPGAFLASPGEVNRNATFIANNATTVSTGSITYMPTLAMNSSGEVAIMAYTSENYATIQLDSGSGLNLAVGGPGISPAGAMSINSSGQVGFFGYGDGGSGLYLYSNGQTNFLIATPGYPFTLAVNSSDTMGLLVMGSSPNPSGIYSYANGIVSGVALDGSPAPGGGNFSFSNPNPSFGPVINDNGDMAFTAALNNSSAVGLYVFSNNKLSRIVGSGDVAPDGSTFTVLSSPSINASGNVAFWGVTTSEVGLFVYSSGGLTKVVASGDTIGTHMVGYVANPQLSDAGHVAFLAELNDGTSAVFVARPRAAGRNNRDLLVTSSHPLNADSPLVKRLQDQYIRIMEERQRRGRKFLHAQPGIS